MTSNIFISYRWSDSQATAVALREFLSNQLPHTSVFLDVAGTIAGGENYLEVIDKRLDDTKVVIAIIGPDWLQKGGTSVPRSIDQPHDMIRHELFGALRRNLIIIPALLDNTPMPVESEIPADIRLIAYKNAKRLRGQSFQTDATEIVHSIKKQTSVRKDRLVPMAAALAALVAGAALGAWSTNPGYRGQTVQDRPDIGLMKIFSQSNDFLHTSGDVLKPMSFQASISGAQREVWFIGTSFFISLDENFSLLLSTLQKGTDLNFVVLDPNSPALTSSSRSLNISFATLRDQCISGIRLLKALDDQLKATRSSTSGRLNVKLVAEQIQSRIYFFDPKTDAGRTYYIPQVNRVNSQNVPGFLVDNGVAKFHTRYFEGVQRLWNSDQATTLDDWIAKHPDN